MSLFRKSSLLLLQHAQRTALSVQRALICTTPSKPSPLPTTPRHRVSPLLPTATECAEVRRSDDHIEVLWKDGHRSMFLNAWLWDHAPEGYHPTSQQRLADTLDIPHPCSTQSATVDHQAGRLLIKWGGAGGARDSAFDLHWLRGHCSSPVERERRRSDRIRPEAWDATFAPHVPIVPHSELMRTDTSSGHAQALSSVLRHGLVVVRGVPSTEAATREAAQRFGIIRRTFYADDIWDTKPKAADKVNDTAYTNIELKPHTDCTYLSHPPGLQIFNCVEQSSEGGRTWLVDGHAIAHTLKARNPKAFEYFCKTTLPFYSKEEGVFVRAEGPVFSFNTDGEMTMFRYNNDDRAALDNMSYEQIREFYTYIPDLLRTMRDPALGLKIKLNVGDMLVVQNQRVLHGREAFVGMRNLVGAYIDRDDFESKARVLGLLQ